MHFCLFALTTITLLQSLSFSSSFLSEKEIKFTQARSVFKEKNIGSKKMKKSVECIGRPNNKQVNVLRPKVIFEII
jgi:hypothetical protein